MVTIKESIEIKDMNDISFNLVNCSDFIYFYK